MFGFGKVVLISPPPHSGGPSILHLYCIRSLDWIVPQWLWFWLRVVVADALPGWVAGRPGRLPTVVLNRVVSVWAMLPSGDHLWGDFRRMDRVGSVNLASIKLSLNTIQSIQHKRNQKSQAYPRCLMSVCLLSFSIVFRSQHLFAFHRLQFRPFEIGLLRATNLIGLCVFSITGPSLQIRWDLLLRWSGGRWRKVNQSNLPGSALTLDYGLVDDRNEYLSTLS